MGGNGRFSDRLSAGWAIIPGHPGAGPARQPAFNVPAVVLGLIAILVALHGLRMVLPPATGDSLLVTYALIPARLILPGPLWDKAVPFVSYMGLHGDWTHLGINCLWLLPFGSVVARRFGAPLFLLFFLVCGIAGAGLILAFLWGALVPIVGASAGNPSFAPAWPTVVSPVRMGSWPVMKLARPAVQLASA